MKHIVHTRVLPLLLGSSAVLAQPPVAAPAAAPVSYRIVEEQGRLAVRASTGERVAWACYALGADHSMEDWQRKQHPFLEGGVRLFQLLLWEHGGQYRGQPFFSFDGRPVLDPHAPPSWAAQAEWLIEQNPDVRFQMRFGITPPPDWRAEHLDHFAPLSRHRGSARDNRSLMPSLASDLFRERTVRLVRDAVGWCERQSWRNRIVGYSIFPYGEGATEVALFDELFDTSPVMRVAFRKWLRARYGSDDALRRAWGDESVSLDGVAVPARQEWLEKKRELGLLHWPEPAQTVRERDYFLLQKELFHRFWTAVFDAMDEATRARPVIKGYDVLKQHLQGWMHNRDFDAINEPETLDTYPHILLSSGSLGAAPLLDHPGLDILQTPGMYYNRAAGYAWEAEGLSDSLVLRGKLNFMEADMRTWVRKTRDGAPLNDSRPIRDAGVFMTPAEMRAGFRRTLAWALTRNQMYYYFSVCGANWWYHEPPVEQEIAGLAELAGGSRTMPWAETEHAICIVVDDESALWEDFSGGFQYLAVYRQIEEGLALCGVAYRIHLLSDLRRDDFPDYRCYLFPNLFRVDAAIEATLREKVLCNGRVAIFGPGTGMTDGERRSAEGASRLLGVPMELVLKSSGRRVILRDHGHPISDRLPTLTYGDTYAYGPLLVPEAQRFSAETGAAQLGAGFFFYFFDRPGLFAKDFGRGAAGGAAPGERGPNDYAVVFTPAVPMPPELLRECARYAGCHVWSEANAVVYASRDLVALHTVRSGRHELALPRPAGVWDVLEDRAVTNRASSIRLDIAAPATRIFRLTPPDVLDLARSLQ